MTTANDLHRQIMELTPSPRRTIPDGAYVFGYADAREDAARVAQSALAAMEQENAKLREAIREIVACEDEDGDSPFFLKAVNRAMTKARAALTR